MHGLFITKENMVLRVKIFVDSRIMMEDKCTMNHKCPGRVKCLSFDKIQHLTHLDIKFQSKGFKRHNVFKIK